MITECGDGMSSVDLGEYDLLHDADLDKVQFYKLTGREGTLVF